MKLERYLCTHCGRHFEAPEKDPIECPNCFWSSSVKKEEELPPKEPPSVPPPPRPEKPVREISFPWKSAGVAAGSAALLGAVFWFALSNQEFQNRLFRRIPGEEASAPGKKKGASDETAALTPEEKTILYQRLQVEPDRRPSEAEKQILQNRANLQTGFVERIPTQAWTLENFRQMIAEQERFYKVPLPKSYKGKLETLFETKYLAAQEAFKQNEPARARDLWMESLIFPLYAKDVAKHRGVVLTMIKPFINDTLSKIGAINSALGEKKIRQKEKALAEAYEELLKLIEQKAWPEASAQILTLEQTLGELERPELAAGGPPPYPASLNDVDEGIRATLIQIQSSAPPAVTDLGPLRRDLAAKRKVIEGFLPANLERAQRHYDEALGLLGRREWEEAEKRFREIDSPLALAEDAAKKIKILKKIRKVPLDSEAKSG